MQTIAPPPHPLTLTQIQPIQQKSVGGKGEEVGYDGELGGGFW